jgi:TRAP-type C4-dicarboxylate transport system permease small subunit
MRSRQPLRLLFALVFVWSGIEFTEFAWYRISELAELPLWLIHIAWPIAGFTWLIFLGEQLLGRVQRPDRPLPLPPAGNRGSLMGGAVLSPARRR